MNFEYYNQNSDDTLQSGGYWPQKINFFHRNISAYKATKKRQITILDLACNEGTLAAQYLKYGKVYGIDINKTAIQKAKKKGVEATFGDVLKLEKTYKDLKFDIVIAGDIIEHIFDTDLFLQNIYAVLKKGGMVLLTTPNLLSFGRRLMAMTGRNPYCEYSAKRDNINVGHIRYYTYNNLYTQLAENKFKHISIESDTLNIPISFIDNYIVTFNPRLGRELMAKAYKL